MKNGKMLLILEVESVYNFIKLGVIGFFLVGEIFVGKVFIRIVEFLKNLIIKYSI